jgi:hypothetical protein
MAGTRWLNKQTMFVFGAGATKACGGPLTAEILPWAFAPGFAEGLECKKRLQKVDDCLIQHFHVPSAAADRRPDDYPPLPLLLSLLDLAIDQDRPLVFNGPLPGSPKDHWSHELLADARKAIEYVIFAVLDAHLKKLERNCYADLFDVVTRACGSVEPSVISLNYDILLDTVLFKIAEDQGGLDADARPTYACDIQTKEYLDKPVGRGKRAEYGTLLKLHGSLNWFYCPCCRRLDVGMSEFGRSVVSCTMVDVLANLHPLHALYVEGEPCPDCDTRLRPVMITPSRAKDYRNPHIQRIWYEAERALRRAEHVCFIGYSLPDDDLEVIDLLRRGLGHLSGECITVVELVTEEEARRYEGKKHPALRRFESIFGNPIDWQPCGFEAWVEDARNSLAHT